jgi:catechol 2,3-dioxygenase-like lactoylglutathione lyase family enzyme
MSTITVQGLNVLAIYVTDLEHSESFYRDQLGFEKTGEMPPGILMEAGRLTLYLVSNRQVKRTESSKVAEFSPCFATESVKSSYEALKAAGVTIAVDYQEFAPTFAFFQIADPDGNLIEFAGEP